MSEDKKTKVGIWMHPDMVKQVDSAYPLNEISSRSEFVCNAVDFYLGFLQTGNSTAYMHKTTLSFLEDQLARLEARICRQLFRMCVEQSMIANVSACQINGVTEDTMKALRKKCVKDVKQTIGNIRYDKIYSFQNDEIWSEEDENESEN